MKTSTSDASVTECVRAWTAAVAGLRHPQTGSAEVERTLAGLTHRLATILRERPFTEAQAYEIGAALVDADLADPEVLGRSIDVLDHYLGALVDQDDAQARIRLVRVLGALGTGFARALLRRGFGAPRPPYERPLSDAAVAVAVTDPHGRVAEVNRALADLLGYAADELVGRQLTDLVHRDEAAALSDALAQVRAAPEAVRLEARLLRRDSAARWLLMALSAAGDGHVVIAAQDVTDHHRLELKLRHQACHDPLTGLPNRALFTERLDRLFQTGGATVGLCFLDLDGFKGINDRLGHQIGDQLLTAVAERINRCVTSDGHLFARIGGDEFTILVDPGGAGDTAEIAEKVLRTLEAPFRLADHELRITASVGVVERPIAGTTPAELLWDADVAMRRAKATGKSRWALLDLDRAGAPHGDRFTWLSPTAH